MTYEPLDPDATDIVDILKYETRFVETAIAVGDGDTEKYAKMCLSAAAEIENLRCEILDLKTELQKHEAKK